MVFRTNETKQNIVYLALIGLTLAASARGYNATSWTLTYDSGCSEPGCGTASYWRLYDSGNNICLDGTFTTNKYNVLLFKVADRQYGTSADFSTLATSGANATFCKNSGGTLLGSYCTTNGLAGGTACSKSNPACGNICDYAPAANDIINMVRVRGVAYFSEPILGTLEKQLIALPDQGLSSSCPQWDTINGKSWNVIPVQWPSNADPTNYGSPPTTPGIVMGLIVSATAAGSGTDPVTSLNLLVGPYFNVDSGGVTGGRYGNPYFNTSTHTGVSGCGAYCWTAPMNSSSNCAGGIVGYAGGGSATGSLYLGTGGWVYNNSASGTLLAVPANSISTLASMQGYYSGFAFDYNGGTTSTSPIRVSVNAAGTTGSGVNVTSTSGANGSGSDGSNHYSLTIDAINAVGYNSDGSNDTRPGMVRARITHNTTQNALCAALTDHPTPYASNNWQTNALICSSAAPESGSLTARSFTWVMVASKGGNGKLDNQLRGDAAQAVDTSTLGLIEGTFGSVGTDSLNTLIAYPNPISTAYSTALVGQLVAVGLANDGSTTGNTAIAARRYNGVDGQLDTTFGSAGLYSAALHTAASPDQGNQRLGAAYLDSAGRIVIAGSSTSSASGPNQFMATRLTTAGALDTTFATSGYYRVHLSSGSNHDEVHGITQQSGGRYVIVGRKDLGAGNPRRVITLIGLTAAGALDSVTFNSSGTTKGIWTADATTSLSDAPGTAVVQNDQPLAGVLACYDWANTAHACNSASPSFDSANFDKLYVGGMATAYASSGFPNDTGFLLRFKSDGSGLDTTFNSGRLTYYSTDNFTTVFSTAFSSAPLGAVTLQVRTGTGHALGIDGMTIGTSGAIYAAGHLSDISGGFAKAFVAKFKTDGTLDTSWNGTGISVLPNNGSHDRYGQNVREQADGRVVFAGRDDVGGTPGTQTFVARFQPDGVLDTSFVGDTTSSVNGIVFYNGMKTPAAGDDTRPIKFSNNPFYDGGNNTVILPDGRIAIGVNTAISASLRGYYTILRLWP